MRDKVRPAARQRPRKGWQRAAAGPIPDEIRETFRVDAPSPGQEILAKHEAELDEPKPEAAETDGDSGVFCF